MKILVQNKASHNIQYMVTYLSGLKNTQFAIIQNIQDTITALVTFFPDIIFLHEDDLINNKTVSNAVDVYLKKNKNAKIVKQSENKMFIGNAKIINDHIRPNCKSLDYYDSQIQKKDVSIFVDNPINENIALAIAKNHVVKIYGKCKINSPYYLGLPTNIQDYYDILNRSKIIIDLGTHVYMDAILCKCIPVLYSDKTDDKLITFNNILSINNVMSVANNFSEYNLKQLRDSIFNQSDIFCIDEILSALNINTDILDDIKAYYKGLLEC